MPAKPGTVTAPGLIVYRFGSDLFFANDHFFTSEVTELIDSASGELRWFIVDAGAITDVDYSAARTLTELIEALRERKIGVIFGRVNRYLRADMDRHCITQIIGASNVFETLHEALAAAGASPAVHEPGAV